MTAPFCYTSCVSAEAGESVALFASAPNSPCTLIIRRVGAKSVEVARFSNIEIYAHPTPENADTCGCGWPEAFRFTVEADWASGYYDLELIGSDGASSHHFIIVRPAKSAKRADAAIIVSTNTYFAYNYWGGANAYAHVESMMAGKPPPEGSGNGAIGRLSRMRPLAQGLFAPAEGVGRLVNMTIRAPGQLPLPGDLDWNAANAPTPFDGSAGFLQKWEHRFAEWAETAGYKIDYFCDHDFEREGNDDLLTDYKTVLIVGHSEYWSGNQRRALDTYVDQGGNLAILSGNTCYWKVRWEEDGQTLIAHKWRGEEDDPLWANEQTRAEATHLWSHPAFNAPEAALTGLSFLYGGYHRICMCASRGAGAFTLYDDTHWAIEGTDLYYGDQIGAGLPLVGYENDGCPIAFGEDSLPKPNGGTGVPENLQIIAMAPATLAEDPDSPYPAMIPPEETDVLAQLAFGDGSAATQKRLMRGHSVMASFKRGKGEVFNSGTTEWAHGLAAGDPFVDQITHNVMKRFGVAPDRLVS